MLNIIKYSHALLKTHVQADDIAIDVTCGNGNDTLFLSKLVGEQGKVFAFDIQAQAINATKQRLSENKAIDNVTLILDSHAKVDHYLTNEQKIGGAIFNLGYLPRSDKTIITKPKSTLEAIQKIYQRLKHGGMIVIVIYYGHDGGETEKEAVLNYVKQLDQQECSVLKYEFINQKNNPPFVIAIKKI